MSNQQDLIEEYIHKMERKISVLEKRLSVDEFEYGELSKEISIWKRKLVMFNNMIKMVEEDTYNLNE